MTYDDPDWSRRTLGPIADGAFKERRSLIWNDNQVVAPVAPPFAWTGVKDRGKFFTRGCRGKLEVLYIYCRRTAAGTLDLSFSPHPCLGPLYTVTITPGAAWAWVGANFLQMWNYDALFVWVSRCDADVIWGFDTLTPPDAHYTTDGGATWIADVRRPYIRALMRGETPGDVPVSGNINAYIMPNVSTEYESGSENILATVTTELVRIEGPGFVELFDAYVDAAASSHLTQIIPECDGNIAGNFMFSWLNTWGYNDDTQPMALISYLEDGDVMMMITKKWEFRRLFRLLAYNGFGNQLVHYEVFPNMMR